MSTAATKTSTAKKPGTQPEGKVATKAPAFRIETGQRSIRYLKLLVYGNYGVGKTTLAGSALQVPEMGNVLMLSAESGDLSLEGDENLDLVDVSTFKQFSAIHQFLIKHCKARDADNIEELRRMESVLKGIDEDDIDEPRQYRTVIIDSLTEVEAYCFQQLLGISDTTKLDDETDSAEWSEYKKNNSMMLRLVRAFRDLPMHVIFVCGEKYNQDETKKMKYTPDMTGQLAKKVQGFMDMVGYLVIGKDGDKKVRKLYVEPSSAGRYDAKHRYQAFKGDHFKEPTIAKILDQVGLAGTLGATLK